MAVRFSKFQTRDFTGWSSIITKANHISMLGGQKPNVVSEFMTQVMARNFGQSIDSELSKFPTKMFADDSEITWDVYGSARRNIGLVKAYLEDGSTPVTSGVAGANGKRFFLEFDEPYFFKGEVIMGNLNQVYPIRLIGDPKLVGTHYLYEAESINGSNDGIPYDRLQPGERFSYAYAPVERGLSKEVGGIRHSGPMKARNEFTMVMFTTRRLLSVLPLQGPVLLVRWRRLLPSRVDSFGCTTGTMSSRRLGVSTRTMCTTIPLLTARTMVST